MEQRVAAALKSQSSILAGGLGAPAATGTAEESKRSSRRGSRAALGDGTQTPQRRNSRASAATNAAAAASSAAASSSSSATAVSSQPADPNAVPGSDNVFCITLFCLDEGAFFTRCICSVERGLSVLLALQVSKRALSISSLPRLTCILRASTAC